MWQAKSSRACLIFFLGTKKKRAPEKNSLHYEPNHAVSLLHNASADATQTAFSEAYGLAGIPVHYLRSAG